MAALGALFMDKAPVALIGLVGVLLFPVSSSAAQTEEFLFQGQGVRLEEWKVTEHGYEQVGTCEISGADADGFVDWKARLVKTCPQECRSPFGAVARTLTAFPAI